jgi:hypothetical protein
VTARPVPCGATTYLDRDLAVCLLDPGHEGPHVDSTLDHHAWDETPPPPEEG